MILTFSYTQELENLIVDTLLPVYEKYQAANGSVNYLSDINPRLLEQVKAKKKLPRLLMKK